MEESAMKTGILTLVATITFTFGTAAQEAGKWISIFDGETLDGWTQLNGKAKYEIQEGAIVGHTAEGSPNSFLCTDQHYGDFELEFEVKCDTGLNSGVQIRSLQKGAKKRSAKGGKGRKGRSGRVYGPQVEIEASPGQSGFVYGEATGLGWLSPEPRSKDRNVNRHSHFKNDDWNHYRIIAKGPRFRTFINGQKICDLTHEKIYETHPKGVIGLQVHSIPKGRGPFQVAWRNLRIRELE